MTKKNYPVWDYVILTASNKSQANAYQKQIEYRQANDKLPQRTHFAVIPDPDGKRVGSGGATLNVLRYIKHYSQQAEFAGSKILVIHSGGDSKRVPQYSACGKLFSPVPRMLPDGRRSSLFDEYMISMTGVPARMTDGMLVLSGDVLLLFNPLQIDFFTKGAVALSIKEDVETGKNHGVFLRDDDGYVRQFLHKKSAETLHNLGAVDYAGRVDIDTGAVMLDSEIIEGLYSIISTDEAFDQYVNETVQLSFYGDFLYPLAAGSTHEQYQKEISENTFTDSLRQCRENLWSLLHAYRLRLLRFSPASFIHFGTTHELLSLLTNDIDNYRFLDWTKHVNTNRAEDHFAASNCFIHKDAVIGKDSYIEDSYIHQGSVIGEKCVISGVTLKNVAIPDRTVLHGLKLTNGKFVVRMYGVDDNPKEEKWFGTDIEQSLWTTDLFPVCDTIDDAVTHIVQRTGQGPLISLKDSFNQADVTAILPWQKKLDDKIKTEALLEAIDNRVFIEEAKRIFVNGLSSRTKMLLLHEADKSDFSRKIRIYYYLSKMCSESEHESLSNHCFNAIRDSVLSQAKSFAPNLNDLQMKREEVTVELPLRVNWGGGWSDTSPHCLEKGGSVLNAAITLNGRLPVQVMLKRLPEKKVILASADTKMYQEFTDISALRDCHNPFDPFALHKAALIVCGVISQTGKESLDEILSRLGGGIYFSTQVINVPKGSGLGTSSILAGACAKSFAQLFDIPHDQNDLFEQALCMEQLMSTGGGWQDQIGGMVAGIKFVTAQPGMIQNLNIQQVKVSQDTLMELNHRFALIYTGQRRLARNLLREIMGKYIGSDPIVLKCLSEIQRISALMRFELERGNIDGFGEMLSAHWEQSKMLDAGSTNMCIDQLFLAVDNLLVGKMICGAGGGGFLQVILKKGVTKEMLRDRLYDVFQDSGVDVWDCSLDTMELV